MKLQIGSDEHIIDTTINRGLLMLLNNDYYLDAKSSLLAAQLSSAIDNINAVYEGLKSHIYDNSMHHQNSIVVNTYHNETMNIVNRMENSFNESEYDSGKLTKDTVKYLPIDWSAAQIQYAIDSTPHDLNGFKLMFLFVVPEGYVAEDSRYVLDLMNNSINFSNFINGTLAVVGDDVTGAISYKSRLAVEDPVKYDNLNVAKQFVKFFSKLDAPEQIDEIVLYESDRANNKNINLNKIAIRGTSFNDDLSLVVFDQNTCQVIVKGLSFESSLKSNTLLSNEVDLKYANPLPSPSLEKLLVYWPLEKDLMPIVNGNFTTIVTDKKAEVVAAELEVAEKYIEDQLTGFVYSEEYNSKAYEDLSGKIDDIDVILSSQEKNAEGNVDGLKNFVYALSRSYYK